MDIKDLTPDTLISGALEKVIPELYELKKVLENNPWHDHETTFFHTLAVLNELHRILSDELDSKLLTYLAQNYEGHTRKELLILATVFHDIGKKDTLVLNDNVSLFPKHELASVSRPPFFRQS